MKNEKNEAICKNEKKEAEGAKARTTEMVFIIDCSGSMAGLESDTVGGFNSMIRKQREEDGECLVSVVLFNDVSRVLYDRKRLFDVPEMSCKDYFTGGATAMLDAIGDAISHVRLVHKYARPEDVPENTVFVITTDGQENASRRYEGYEVKRMIKDCKEWYGWEFLFIGANIDAVETASRYGIGCDRAVNYHADKEGTRVMYDAVSCAVSDFRGRSCITKDWLDTIEEDYTSRKRGEKKVKTDKDK